jgi:hypothetical protein
VEVELVIPGVMEPILAMVVMAVVHHSTIMDTVPTHGVIGIFHPGINRNFLPQTNIIYKHDSEIWVVTTTVTDAEVILHKVLEPAVDAVEVIAMDIAESVILMVLEIIGLTISKPKFTGKSVHKKI